MDLSRGVVLGDRLAAVRLPIALVITLCVDQSRVEQPLALACLAGVPPDAQFVGARPAGADLLCIFRHPSFPLPRVAGQLAELPCRHQSFPLTPPQPVDPVITSLN